MTKTRKLTANRLDAENARRVDWPDRRGNGAVSSGREKSESEGKRLGERGVFDVGFLAFDEV